MMLRLPCVVLKVQLRVSARSTTTSCRITPSRFSNSRRRFLKRGSLHMLRPPRKVFLRRHVSFCSPSLEESRLALVLVHYARRWTDPSAQRGKCGRRCKLSVSHLSRG